MKNLYYFIAGVILITLISATTVNIMTVKPIIPKVVIVKSFNTMINVEYDIENFIRLKIKEGYIVKSISISESETRSKGVVVLEKY